MSAPSRATTGSGRLAAILLAMIIAANSVVAHAAVTTLFDKGFHDNQAGGTGIIAKPLLPAGATGTNHACLTSPGNILTGVVRSCTTFNDTLGQGKLRLTDTTASRLGGVFGTGATTNYDMQNNKAIHATFNVYQYGGTEGDGLTFTFAAADPGAKPAPATLGQSGGSLGVAPVRSSGLVGLPNVYLSFGFDTAGAFSTTDRQGAACAAQTYITTGTNIPGQVVVRGPGAGTTGYCGINSTATDATSPALTLRAATRAESAMPVEVVLNPSSGTVRTTSGLTVPSGQYLVKVTTVGGTVRTLNGTLPTVPTALYPAPSWLNGGYPKFLNFGWTASNGTTTDFHELDDARVQTIDPAPVLTVSQTSQVATSPQQGDPVTYTITPAVAAGNPGTAPVTVTQTLPAGVVPLGAYGTGWVCQAPSGQTISCTNSNTPFAAGASLPVITVVAIVTAAGVTPTSVQSGTSVTATASDAVTGTASSAPAGTLGTAPTGVAVSPTSGPLAGGNSVTVSGTNITTATAVEFGTTAQFQAGTPTVFLPCPSGPAAGCFTVSGATLQISAMPAHAAGEVQVKVVTQGVAGSATYTYVDLALTFGPPPAGTVGVAYATTLTATGGQTPYTWSVTAGSLPPGLQLGAATGAITGTPTVAGTFAFTVQVADAGSGTATQATSITVNAGLLSLSVPSSVDLGPAASGAATLSAALGTVTVTDNRGASSAAWQVTVSATTFTTGAGGSGQTIPAARIAYDTGTWGSSGTGTFVPASLPNGALPGVGASWTGGVGANSATWNPNLTFTFVQSQVAGQYSGVITHSVA
ncbi:putative Ig domain-containing protein [Actinophytocola sp.]|uniref:putative Ig domain-containing protein n=1 Tax=Actinophytocola sp. TaxID=1872138 RepID=UPI002ED5292D